MSERLKVYSVVINWQDGTDKGDFGTVVRAHNAEEAEAIARAEMRAFDEEHYDDDDDDDEEPEYGSLIACDPGYIWEAQNLEDRLRDIVAASDANDHGSLMNAIDAAKTLLAQLDDKAGGA